MLCLKLITADSLAKNDIKLKQLWMLLKPGTGNAVRESENECTAVIPIRIQNRLFKVYLRFFGRYSGLSFITGIKSDCQ